MLDFGFDKIALIGAVALVVIGPEKLPRVARTVGAFIGKAQRYVADVKAEVNRSIELEELKKVKTQFEDAARNVERDSSDRRRARPVVAGGDLRDLRTLILRFGERRRLQLDPAAAAVSASEEELAPQARRPAALVQAAQRHPR
jgi:Tat protein translocase TatB subunit